MVGIHNDQGGTLCGDSRTAHRAVETRLTRI